MSRQTTYQDVLDTASVLLATAGKFTLVEHAKLGQPELTSVNEIVGMASRAISERAESLQQMADGKNNV